VFLIGCTNEVEAAIRRCFVPAGSRTWCGSACPIPPSSRISSGWRLKGDLVGSAIVASAAGKTGADAERAVKDARRVARRENRKLRLDDLRRAVVGDDDLSAQSWRTSVHEAGHAVVDVLHFGADGVVANTTRTDRRLGMSMRTSTTMFDGTPTAIAASKSCSPTAPP
jgi:cell division protease FtsH